MENPKQMRAHIIAKASEDETFRDNLLSDPKTTIEGELGVTIPEGMTVQVHENTAQSVHLVLPSSSRLSDADLRAAAGGGKSSCWNSL